MSTKVDQPQEQKDQQLAVEGQENELKIDEAKLARYLEGLKLEQNFPKAVVAGLISSIFSAVVWAAITVATDYQIGYMAVAVGFLVGFAVRTMGKGLDKIFGVVGASFALIGCILGNVFTLIGYAANESGTTYFETLFLLDYSIVPTYLMETFSPIDLLFYGIAIYEGYNFSFRKLTEEELIAEAGN